MTAHLPLCASYEEKIASLEVDQYGIWQGLSAEQWESLYAHHVARTTLDAYELRRWELVRAISDAIGSHQLVPILSVRALERAMQRYLADGDAT